MSPKVDHRGPDLIRVFPKRRAELAVAGQRLFGASTRATKQVAHEHTTPGILIEHIACLVWIDPSQSGEQQTTRSSSTWML